MAIIESDDLVVNARRNWHRARASGDAKRILKARSYLRAAERDAADKHSREWTRKCEEARKPSGRHVWRPGS